MSTPASKPVVAMVHVVPTPYWVHLHRRLAAELPEVTLRVAYTHDVADQSWRLDLADDLNAVSFGDGKPWEPKKPLEVTAREWAKGGRIARWIREQRADAVVLGGYSDAGRVRLLASCRMRRIPVLLHGDSNIHGDRAGGIKRIVKRLIVRRVVKTCAAVLPFGTAGRRFFMRYGARPDRVFYMPGEPDYAIIERVAGSLIDEARARYDMPSDRRRIVFSGRLIPLKRVGDLIDAFLRVAPRHPEWDLVIVGDGPLRDDLKRRVPAAWEQRVKWCGFVSEAERLASIYKACDMLVLPISEDAWALVVNEALAAGLAVIVSNVVGAADDLVRDGENGRVFPPGDVSALASCIEDVIAPSNLERYKAASAAILRDWRTRGDPVAGLRAALRTIGVL